MDGESNAWYVVVALVFKVSKSPDPIKPKRKEALVPYLMVEHGLGFNIRFEIGVGEDREVSLPFAGDDALGVLVDLES